MAEKRSDTTPQTPQQLTRRQTSTDVGSPFRALERFASEVDRMFDDFGFGRWMSPGRSWGIRPFGGAETMAWAPDVDVFQRSNELVIRADLPGMTKEDIKVDVTDDAITIQGERRREHEEERGGVFRSERSYGSFHRVIPVPEGAMTDQAKATFKDGMLEITMPAPPEQVTRGRRLEIAEGSAAKK